VTGSSGSFTAPDHGDENYFELVLTATDSAGKTNTSRVEIHPQESQVTLATNPSGLQVVLDGTQGTTPLTRSLIVGSTHTIYAPSPQNNLVFGSWSDGGAQSHNIVAPADATTYTATYAADTTPPTITLSETIRQNTASFTFSADEPATFECQLDGGVSSVCSSPKKYTKLARGSHTFSVRATDASGNTATASRTWTVQR
jgi:hypothetical protein